MFLPSTLTLDSSADCLEPHYPLLCRTCYDPTFCYGCRDVFPFRFLYDLLYTVCSLIVTVYHRLPRFPPTVAVTPLLPRFVCRDTLHAYVTYTRIAAHTVWRLNRLRTFLCTLPHFALFSYTGLFTGCPFTLPTFVPTERPLATTRFVAGPRLLPLRPTQLHTIPYLVTCDVVPIPVVTLPVGLYSTGLRPHTFPGYFPDCRLDARFLLFVLLTLFITLTFVNVVYLRLFTLIVG